MLRVLARDGQLAISSNILKMFRFSCIYSLRTKSASMVLQKGRGFDPAFLQFESG